MGGQNDIVLPTCVDMSQHESTKYPVILMGFMEFIHSYPLISMNYQYPKKYPKKNPLNQSPVSNAMKIDLRCHPRLSLASPPRDRRRPPRWRRTRGVPAAPRRRCRPAGPGGRCCSARASGPWHRWRSMGIWEMHWKKLVKQVSYIYI